MPLDIKKTFAELRAQYEDQRESFNALVIGDTGKGKTYSLKTARFPLLVYQFDPGGAVTLRKEIQEGKVMVLDYSGDDPTNPTGFKRWLKDFYKHKTEGLFDHLGTVALDSLTTWGDSLMLATLKDNGRAAKQDINLFHGQGSKINIPELRDWQTQMVVMEQLLKALLGLPCDFIAIGHIAKERDEVSGKMFSGPMVTGKLAMKLPLLFDELYVADTETKANGTDYFFLTQPSGIHNPRSRMAAEGKLAPRERPNFKHIMKTCGWDTSDLPLFVD